MIGINPYNHKQARMFLSIDKKIDAGINENSMILMRNLSFKHGFKIIGAVPQSLFDGWDFWIEFDTFPEGLPDIFRDVPWKAVNTY